MEAVRELNTQDKIAAHIAKTVSKYIEDYTLYEIKKKTASELKN